jgi:hypothetical protein
MVSVMDVQKLQDKEKEGEKAAARTANRDSGGDWGKDPSNARFTRRAYTMPDK